MIELLNEDCMAVMARYPDKYFDLAIVDPPCGIGANKMTLGNGKFIEAKIIGIVPLQTKHISKN